MTKTIAKKDKRNQNLYITLPPKAFNDLAYCKQGLKDPLFVDASSSVVVQVALDHYAKYLEQIVKLQRTPGQKQARATLDGFYAAAHAIAGQYDEPCAFRFNERDYHLKTREEATLG